MDYPPSVCSLLLIFAIAKAGLAQQVDIDCGYFSTPPMNLTIAEGQGACVECGHSGQRLTQWQIWMDMSYTSIDVGNEPTECSCTAVTGRPAGRLCFNRVDSSTENMYRCIVQRDGIDGDLSACPFQIELAEPPVLSPTTPSPLEAVNTGDTVTLSPSVDSYGNPPGGVTWYHGNGSVVQLGGRFTLIDNMNLRISSIEPNDRGVYMFNVSNIGGSVVGNVQLFVNFAEILSFDVVSHSDGSATATCVGQGYPFSTVFSLTPNMTLSRMGSPDIGFEAMHTLSTTLSPMDRCPIVFVCRVDPGVAAFAERSINHCNSVPTTSDPDTEDPCDSRLSRPLSPVTGVSVNTVTTSNGNQNVQLAWRSTEGDVVAYLVTVQPCPSHLTCPIRVEGKTNNSLSFSEEICGAENYSFFVQAIDSCKGTSPSSSQVERTCAERNRLTTLSSLPNSLRVEWSFVATDEILSLNVTVTRLDVIMTLSYKVEQSAFNVQSVCLNGLETDTTYQVCLSSQFKNNPTYFPQYCDEVTFETVEGTPPSGCLFPINIVTPTPEDVVIQHWQIAIIVVGALAIVAMVFCCVGLCFACQSSKQKVDFGSNSSLNTSTYNTGSIRDVQRSNSPSRSCLSYHIKGHSTNWSDHVDTLRQMETDGGTHV